MNKRVIFITSSNIFDGIDSGGKQATYRNLDVLKEIWGKNNIKCIIISKEIKKISVTPKVMYIPVESNRVLRNLNFVGLRYGYSKNSENRIKTFIEEYKPDIMVIDHTYLGKISRLFRMPIIAFYHNIEKDFFYMMMKSRKGKGFFSYISAWMNEKYISNKDVFKICLNYRDGKKLTERYRVEPNYIMPISMQDIAEGLTFSRKKTGVILFVGSFFYPNVKGVQWFCTKVMPHIDRKLIIVGNGMEKLRNVIQERDNIEIHGRVEDLSQYYIKADAVVIPIFLGEGMKVKTAEALMYGKPIFATDEALEGYDVEGTEDIYRCNTKEEFILNILKQNKYGYSEAVRTLYLEKYETKKVQRGLEKRLFEAKLL